MNDEEARAEAERRWPDEPLTPRDARALARKYFVAGAVWQASQTDERTT